MKDDRKSQEYTRTNTFTSYKITYSLNARPTMVVAFFSDFDASTRASEMSRQNKLILLSLSS